MDCIPVNYLKAIVINMYRLTFMAISKSRYQNDDQCSLPRRKWEQINMQIQELFRVLHCCFPVPKALGVNSQTGGGIIIIPLSLKSNESFFDVSIACFTLRTPKGMKMRFHSCVCLWVGFERNGSWG